MKQTIILAALASIFMVSCDNSIEKQIEREFKEWVKVNYDDPKAFKEVVNIECVDTISLHGYANMAKQFKDFIPKYNEIHSSRDSVVYRLDACKNKLTNQDRMDLRTPLLELLLSRRSYLKLQELGMEYEYEWNSVISDALSGEDIQIYHYEVKVRNSVNGELKIHTYHCFIDNRTNGYDIRTNDIPKEELPKEFETIIKCIDDLRVYTGKLGEAARATVEHSNEIRDIIDKY